MDDEPLTSTEARGLLLLYKHNFMTCAQLGDYLWNVRRVAGNCSCPYARPAGSLIKRLKARGLVQRRARVPRDGRTFYEPTHEGERLILKDHATRVAAGLEAAQPQGRGEGRR